MADKFDPYRESLVIEQTTVWPEDLQLEPAERAKVEQSLHADPASASNITYVRLHTGFCRTITVTEQDLQRLGVA